MYNVEEKVFSSFTLTYLSQAYNFPVSEVNLTNDWINSLTIDYIGCAKMMMTKGKSFWHRESVEHETSSLRTPYRLVALMLNRIFGKDDVRFYKIGWIPLMYHVTMEGTIFNWVDIIANNLSSCISAAFRGLLQWKFEFYMGSFFIICILCLHPFKKFNCSWRRKKHPFTLHTKFYGLTSITTLTSSSVRNS